MRELDHIALARLLRWTPRHGVISVYLDIDPADRGEGWRIALRNATADIVGESRENGDHEQRAAVAATVERIRARFPEESPHHEGRSHAGFVEVAEKKGDERWYAFDVALRGTEVAHNRRPYLRPLLSLIDDGAPRGVVVISAERVRLFGWALGRLEETDSWDLTLLSGDWRERKAQGMSDPARGQAVSASGRDQYGERLDANRQRFMREVAGRVREHWARRDWLEVIGFGDKEWAREFAEGIGNGEQFHHVSDHDLISQKAGEIGARVAEAVEGLNRSRELRLVERVKGAAYRADARGSLGVQETLEALVQGRVEHLLFDAERDYAAVPLGEGLAYGAEDGGDDELPLADRMIELALTTDAKITPLEAEAAEQLAEHDGVAALLRY